MLTNKIKNYLFFVLYILVNPRLLKIFLRRIYIPVYIQYEWLNKYDIGTVVDVGTYHGDILQSLHYLFPEADLHAFEPVKENCRLIKSKIHSKKLLINKVALSNKVGKSNFFKNEYLPASSILPFNSNYSIKYNFMDKVTLEEVNTTTLDVYFKNKKIKNNIFLKVDTQGAEGLVLKGGKNFLEKVAIIHVETSFDELYLNQDKFDEIYSYLFGLEFKYFGDVKDSDFYPFFSPEHRVNSIFVNTKLLTILN